MKRRTSLKHNKLNYLRWPGGLKEQASLLFQKVCYTNFIYAMEKESNRSKYINMPQIQSIGFQRIER